MWYVIEGFYGDDVLDKRKAARAAHLERLHILQNQGRLLVAGPCPTIDAEDPGAAGFTGSIIIAEFAALDEAKSWAEGDPYILEGVYTKTRVRPFVKVLP